MVAMLILGIDPGLRCTGYGFVRLERLKPALIEAGVIRTTEGTGLPQRLCELASGLKEIMDGSSPDAVVVESLYSHYRHPRTAILMGHARGVVIQAAAERGVTVLDYPATRVKKSLTGNGRASKRQMQRAVMSALFMREMPEPADVADALAVALCHANVLCHEVRRERLAR